MLGTRISAEYRLNTLGEEGFEGLALVVLRWKIALKENDRMKSARRMLGDGTVMTRGRRMGWSTDVL